MARGPHGKGPGLVEHLPGSDQAKRKLRIVLETIADRKSVQEACQELGIGKTAFHEMRARLLEEALGLMEPRPPGRPRHTVSAGEDRVVQLEAEVRRLRTEVDIAHVREEILLAMPGVFQPAKAGRKKKRKRSGDAASRRRDSAASGNVSPGEGSRNLEGERSDTKSGEGARR